MLYEKIFLNLRQTDGPEVILSISTLLSRLAEAANTPEGQQAIELLAQRGLTEEVKQEVLEQIQRFKESSQAELPDYEPASLEEQKKALADV